MNKVMSSPDAVIGIASLTLSVGLVGVASSVFQLGEDHDAMLQKKANPNVSTVTYGSGERVPEDLGRLALGLVAAISGGVTLSRRRLQTPSAAETQSSSAPSPIDMPVLLDGPDIIER